MDKSKMTRISNTREQIMDRAGHLLMSRGFNGFSYRDISSHLGVKNAAVHYHFPAKADLAMALVDEYRQTLRKGTAEFMAYGGQATVQLEGLFAFTSKQCLAGRCICPFGAFSIDYTQLPDEVRNATAGFMDETIKWLTQVLEVGREQEEFSFNGEAKPRALSILAGLQGARQMARIHGIELLDSVILQVRFDLGLSN
jgi:TetR/AcrR family transcriptional repressor of nem operon